MEDIKYTTHDDISNFTKNIDPNKKNSMVPPPPKPGEVMICQACGKPMLPEDFSKNETIRKKEFKWHMHYKCMQTMESMLDRMTPGLLSERNRQWKR